MLITRVTAYAVKADQVYAMSGGVTTGTTLPGSDYLRFGDYPQNAGSAFMTLRLD